MRVATAVSISALLIACSPDEATAQSDSLLEGRGSPAPTADAALAYLNLDSSGAGMLSFDSVDTQGSAKIFSNVSIESPDGDGSVTAETLRLVNPRETDGGVVFDALEFLNISGGDDEATFTLDRLALVGPSPELARLVSTSFAGEEPDEDYDWGLFSSYEFAELSLSGLSVQGDGTELENLSLDTISLTGMAAGRLANFAFAGLELAVTGEDGEDVSMSLGEMAFNGLDLQALDEFAGLDMEDEEALQAALLSSSFNDPYKKYYDDYALRDISVSVDGVNVGLESYAGELQQTRVGLESHDTLRGLTVSFDGSKETGAQALQGLSMLGYDSLTIEGDFVQTMNEVEDRAYSEEFSLRVIDALELELDYDIGGLADYIKNASKMMSEPNLFAGVDVNPEEMMEMYAPLILSNFELRLRDDSIVERALDAVAEQQGSTPERVRQQAIGMLALGSVMAPPELQGLVGDAITAATTFLEEPGSTVSIALAPAEPTPLVDIIGAFETGDIEAGMSLLNLQISATN